MLINLSNHPSSEWEKEQLDEATRLFGKLTDLPFPVIDPDWNKETVLEAAVQYAKSCLEIIKQGNDDANAIHIMGELTFCFQFVQLMKQHNIPCVASTTSRISEKTQLGKISRFVFRKFRNYY